MCDTLIMTEGSGALPGGSGAGQGGHRAGGEFRRILGGAAMHAEIAGTVDYHEPDDAHALQRIRNLAQMYAPATLARRGRGNAGRWRNLRSEPQDLLGIVPPEGGSRPYDMREVIGRLVGRLAF